MADVNLPSYAGTGFKFENKTIGDIISGTDGKTCLIFWWWRV